MRLTQRLMPNVKHAPCTGSRWQPGIGVSASTLTRTRLGGRMEVDGMLAMVRWLDRTAESFTYGYEKPG